MESVFLFFFYFSWFVYLFNYTFLGSSVIVGIAFFALNVRIIWVQS